METRERGQVFKEVRRGMGARVCQEGPVSETTSSRKSVFNCSFSSPRPAALGSTEQGRVIGSAFKISGADSVSAPHCRELGKALSRAMSGSVGCARVTSDL